jgi:hypothetical protein
MCIVQGCGLRGEKKGAVAVRFFSKSQVSGVPRTGQPSDTPHTFFHLSVLNIEKRTRQREFRSKKVQQAGQTEHDALPHQVIPQILEQADC